MRVGTSPRIASQAIDQLTHLLGIRGDLAGSARVVADELLRWDDRITAQVDVLRLGGAEAAHRLHERCALCRQPGDAAALAALPAWSGDGDALERAVAALMEADADLDHLRAVRTALVQAPSSRCVPLLPRLLTHRDGRVRRLALGACAGHGTAPPEALAALRDERPEVRLRAVRLAAELALPDHVPPMPGGSADATWALAWSAALRGGATTPDGLLAATGRPWWCSLPALAARWPEAVAGWWHTWQGDPALRRRAVLLIGCRGYGADLPMLVAVLADAEARPAARLALLLMTGIDWDAADVPDPATWLERTGRGYAAHERHRWGALLSPASCQAALRAAPQPLRQVVAWDLAALTGAMLLPVWAPVRRQRRWLG